MITSKTSLHDNNCALSSLNYAIAAVAGPMTQLCSHQNVYWPWALLLLTRASIDLIVRLPGALHRIDKHYNSGKSHSINNVAVLRCLMTRSLSLSLVSYVCHHKLCVTDTRIYWGWLRLCRAEQLNDVRSQYTLVYMQLKDNLVSTSISTVCNSSIVPHNFASASCDKIKRQSKKSSSAKKMHNSFQSDFQLVETRTTSWHTFRPIDGSRTSPTNRYAPSNIVNQISIC